MRVAPRGSVRGGLRRSAGCVSACCCAARQLRGTHRVRITRSRLASRQRAALRAQVASERVHPACQSCSGGALASQLRAFRFSPSGACDGIAATPSLARQSATRRGVSARRRRAHAGAATHVQEHAARRAHPRPAQRAAARLRRRRRRRPAPPQPRRRVAWRTPSHRRAATSKAAWQGSASRGGRPAAAAAPHGAGATRRQSARCKEREEL